MPQPATRHGSTRSPLPRLIVEDGAGDIGPLVVALLTDRQGMAVIHDALRGHATVRFCAHTDDLVASVCTSHPTGVIIELREPAEEFEVSIRDLKRGFPDLPILAFGAMQTQSSARLLLAAGRAGADDVILRGYDLGVTVRALLASAADRCLAAYVMREVEEVIPASVRPVLTYCLRHATARVTVSQVATLSGVRRQTLAERLSAAGMPPASTMIGWCRLLAAARLMTQPGLSLERIATHLGFGSSAALHNMLKRYTGLRPSGVRQSGGLRCVVAAFRDALARQSSLFGAGAGRSSELSRSGRGVKEG